MIRPDGLPCFQIPLYPACHTFSLNLMTPPIVLAICRIADQSVVTLSIGA